MSEPDINHYDYIIVGNGLAGLQLALAFAEDSFFNDKSFALIDRDLKNKNDKTWSFWEIGKGKWQHIVHKEWQKSRFVSPNLDISQGLSPYTYKTIRSIDFYDYAKSVLDERQNFHFILDAIEELIETPKSINVVGSKSNYSAAHVFDSRVPEAYFKDTNCTKIQQHFKGYFIKCREDVFNPEIITVMDYRIRYNGSTSFIYVLPTSKREALIEYTFFTPDLVEESVYDNHVKKYINEFLSVDDFEILEIEKGNIPMTDFNFLKFNTEQITKIGTGGGWVKGSTGYSFKHTEIKVEKIIANIKQGKRPSTNLLKNRFRFYDSIFLKVLHDYNHKGMAIFEKFYSKNKPKDTFMFLDETSNILQEVRIMFSMYSKEFVNVFIKKLLR